MLCITYILLPLVPLPRMRHATLYWGFANQQDPTVLQRELLFNGLYHGAIVAKNQLGILMHAGSIDRSGHYF